MEIIEEWLLSTGNDDPGERTYDSRERRAAFRQSSQSRSFNEHAPGPRGSPHDPQGELPEKDGRETAPLFEETAKTESCGSSFLLWHFGHAAVCLPNIRASNSCWHSWQMYSKIGIKENSTKKIASI